jgi:endoglucanase
MTRQNNKGSEKTHPVHLGIRTIPTILMLTTLMLVSGHAVAGIIPESERSSGDSGVAASVNGILIHVNQLGFAPADEKWVIVEDSKNTGIETVARLQRKFKKGWGTVRQLEVEAEESRWGSRFLRFNFSSYTREGTYRIAFDGTISITFKIGKDVYKDLQADTLEQYLPIQMSHISVSFGKLGHDRCFMDDGIHIGPGVQGPDNFESFKQMEPDSKPGTHMFLNVGGWHDAGDYDINVANNSFAVLMLSWSYERFGDKRDVYGIRWQSRQLNTKKGNKIPDVVEQIAWGAEWLLSMQAENGRVYDAVVARTSALAFADKAPEKLTDNKFYEGSIQPGSVSNTSAVRDDRDVYTNTTTPNLLKFIAATAAASRAVKGDDYELSNRLIKASEKAWSYFRSNSQIWTGPNDQYRYGKEQMMLSAAAELYRTTGKIEYLNYIRSNQGWIDEMSVEWPGYINSYGNWFALPFLAKIDSGDNNLRDRVRRAVQRWVDYNSKVEAGNIFGVNIDNLSRWWGCNADFLGFAATYSILCEEFPTTVPARRGKRYLHWVLGLHPGPNYSFVTGVGANSPKFPHSQLLIDLYGKTPGGIAGGVVPGLQLTADNKRLNYSDDREIYEQNEYTLDSAASFLYAAQAWQ